MKKHLNTLFVTTQGAYLAKEGETIGGIVCFGNVSCSPFLMGFCYDVATSSPPCAGAWIEEDIRMGLATRVDFKNRIDFL